LNAIGLDKNKLAVPLPSGKIAGKISPTVAASLGLQHDVLVVTGGHDQCCGAMGAGIDKAGIAMYALGTVECTAPVFDLPIFSDELFRNNLCTYHHVLPGQYITLGYSLTGGNLIKWCKNELALPIAQGENVYEKMIHDLPEAPTNLLALPYFTPSGTPYFETDLGGAILGLRLSTKREEIIKALLEAVTFEMRLNLDIMQRSGIEINQLNMIGGGTKLQKLVQLKADILGKQIHVLKTSEAGCLSAAMLACVAHSGESIKMLMRDWIKTAEIVEPDKEKAVAYSVKYEAYKKLYPKL
jgi:xylulokinase